MNEWHDELEESCITTGLYCVFTSFFSFLVTLDLSIAFVYCLP